MKPVPKISEAEWTVMKVIWKCFPITAAEVIEALSESTEWKPKTIGTLINRLVKKGALQFEKRGKVHYYAPAVSQERCLEQESRTFLNRYFGGALNPLLAHFFEQENLTPEDIRAIKEMVDRLED